MDHFYIRQICTNCMRGTKNFQIDLNMYDDNGLLLYDTLPLENYRFICHYCWRTTTLDFYKFSHPDLIRYLKSLHRKYTEVKKLVDMLHNLLSNNY